MAKKSKKEGYAPKRGEPIPESFRPVNGAKSYPNPDLTPDEQARVHQLSTKKRGEYLGQDGFDLEARMNPGTAFGQNLPGSVRDPRYKYVEDARITKAKPVTKFESGITTGPSKYHMAAGEQARQRVQNQVRLDSQVKNMKDGASGSFKGDAWSTFTQPATALGTMSGLKDDAFNHSPEAQNMRTEQYKAAKIRGDRVRRGEPAVQEGEYGYNADGGGGMDGQQGGGSDMADHIRADLAAYLQPAPTSQALHDMGHEQGMVQDQLSALGADDQELLAAAARRRGVDPGSLSHEEGHQMIAEEQQLRQAHADAALAESDPMAFAAKKREEYKQIIHQMAQPYYQAEAQQRQMQGVGSAVVASAVASQEGGAAVPNPPMRQPNRQLPQATQQPRGAAMRDMRQATSAPQPDPVNSRGGGALAQASGRTGVAHPAAHPQKPYTPQGPAVPAGFVSPAFAGTGGPGMRSATPEEDARFAQIRQQREQNLARQQAEDARLHGGKETGVTGIVKGATTAALSAPMAPVIFAKDVVDKGVGTAVGNVGRGLASLPGQVERAFNPNSGMTSEERANAITTAGMVGAGGVEGARRAAGKVELPAHPGEVTGRRPMAGVSEAYDPKPIVPKKGAPPQKPGQPGVMATQTYKPSAPVTSGAKKKAGTKAPALKKKAGTNKKATSDKKSEPPPAAPVNNSSTPTSARDKLAATVAAKKDILKEQKANAYARGVIGSLGGEERLRTTGKATITPTQKSPQPGATGKGADTPVGSNAKESKPTTVKDPAKERQQRSDAKVQIDKEANFRADNKKRDPIPYRPGTKFEIQQRRPSPVQEQPNPRKNANRDLVGKDDQTGTYLYKSETDPKIVTPRINHPKLKLGSKPKFAQNAFNKKGK